MINTNNISKRFEFVLNSTLDGFIGMDYYDSRMFPSGCKNSSSWSRVRIYLNGTYFDYVYMMDYQRYAFVHRNWTAGRYSVII